MYGDAAFVDVSRAPAAAGKMPTLRIDGPFGKLPPCRPKQPAEEPSPQSGAPAEDVFKHEGGQQPSSSDLKMISHLRVYSCGPDRARHRCDFVPCLRWAVPLNFTSPQVSHPLLRSSRTSGQRIFAFGFVEA